MTGHSDGRSAISPAPREPADDAAPSSGDRRLDGNAMAGPLRELFSVDVVSAQCACAQCGATAPLAEHMVYADAPALIVRCRTCTGVVLRYAGDRRRMRLDLSGARLLVVSTDDATP